MIIPHRTMIEIITLVKIISIFVSHSTIVSMYMDAICIFNSFLTLIIEFFIGPNIVVMTFLLQTRVER